MTRTISLVNQKGGVCKTTIAAQIAYGLALRGQKVLAIDLDPQGNFTSSLGLAPAQIKTTVADALKARKFQGIYAPGILSLVPADISLAEMERALSGLADWQFLLQRAIKHDLESEPGRWDYIIIDSPPNLGLLTINALMAAQEVLIPTTCDSYAFKGLGDLHNTIDTIKTMNPTLSILGVLATRVNMQRNIDRECLDILGRRYGDLLFQSRIPENTALKEAGGLGKSIWEYAPNSLAAPALSSLIEEIEARRAVYAEVQ